MEWNQRLAQARKACGLTQQEAADRIRQYLPESDWVQKVTLSSWEQGRTQPRIPHALALALLYHTDPYYLFGTAQMSGGLNEEGLAKLAEFRELLLESPRYHERVEVSRKVRYLPVFMQPASAGTGQWLDDDLAEEMEVDDAVPARAEFGVRLAGDSMSPRFADGQIVWARKAEQAENGEIVLCVLNDQGYCKKLRYDENGVFLVSLNPAYQPIPVRESDEFRIAGVVVG